jgi:Ca2+-binding EF-hand superfamily protein
LNSRRAEAVAQLASSAAADGDIGFMRHLTATQVEQVMSDAFRAADVDGSGSLDRFEMNAVIQVRNPKPLTLNPKS